MEDALVDRNMIVQDHEDTEEATGEKREKPNTQLLSAEQRSKIAFFTAIMIFGELAAVALVQLIGIYVYGRDFLSIATARVGWSAYSSGLGVGYALLIAGVVWYTRIQCIEIRDWPGFASVLFRTCTALLIITPLMGQVNTYTAMCQGLGVGIENASLVGSKIAEALISTICGYGSFSFLLLVSIFALNGKDADNGCA